MKRIALIKHLKRNGCFLKREGSGHSLWASPNTNHIESIPRHNEISDKLARKICKGLLIMIIGK